MIFESHSHIVKYLGWKGWTKHSVFDNFSFSSVALVCFFFDNVSQEFGAQTSFHLGSSFLNYISSLFVPVSEILITLHKSCFSIAEWTKHTVAHVAVTFGNHYVFNSSAAGAFAATLVCHRTAYCLSEFVAVICGG